MTTARDFCNAINRKRQQSTPRPWLYHHEINRPHYNEYVIRSTHPSQVVDGMGSIVAVAYKEADAKLIVGLFAESDAIASPPSSPTEPTRPTLP